MSSIVNLRSVADTIHWESVFRVLGVKRCQILFSSAGVPANICSRPIAVMEAAQHFWNTIWEGVKWQGQPVGRGYSDPGFPENYRLGFEALVEQTFFRIAGEYGDADAQDLYSWVERHFIDHQQIDLWRTWSALLSGADLEAEAPELTQEALRGIRQIVKVHFEDARSIESQLLSQSENTPLSKIEKRIVTLEVSQPNDFTQFNLIQILEGIIQHEHARQIWLEFYRLLDNRERETVLWWGYAEAARVGISASDVMLPALVHQKSE